ncbi:hypothetical protein H0H93_003643, partial [Arthromyces matolae]
MSNGNLPTEQLLELLVQLKKTTPEAARSILNGQPQIAYALMTLMVKLNAVNFEVFQKTLADFGSKAPTPAPAPPVPIAAPINTPSASVSTTPIPSLPPHMQTQYHHRTTTPPSHTQYPYTNGQPYSHPQPVYGSYTQPQPQPQPTYSYGYPPPQVTHNHGYTTTSQPPAPAPSTISQPTPRLPIPESLLASIPDDQKALIIRVISMTQEQLNALPIQE